MNEKPGSFSNRISDFLKSGKLPPALCNVVGYSILVLVIITSLPLSLPQFMGYEIYEVVSGSMEPNIPVGSVVYARYAEPETIEAGDVIVFRSDDDMITHRVVRNKVEESEFVTKGDANANQDPYPVAYKDVVGKVERHFPSVGRLLSIYSSAVGKLYVFMVAASGLMFNMIASRLRQRMRSVTAPDDLQTDQTSQEEPAETPGEADTGRISADEIMEERREKEKAFREASGQAGASYPGPVAASENDPGNDMAPEPPAVEKSGRE